MQVAGIMVAIGVCLLGICAPEDLFIPAKWKNVMQAPAVMLTFYGALLLALSVSGFFRIAFIATLGVPTLMAVLVFESMKMRWMSVLTVLFSVGMYALLRGWISQICTRADMRLPVVARDFWHMHEMIRRQNGDPSALKNLFAAIDESELLFDRSWEAGAAFYINAMDVREDLPLAGVFLRFEPQEKGINDALIDRIDAVVDAAQLSMHARLFGLSVCAEAGTAQVMFYAQPGREKSVLRMLERLARRNGFKDDAVLLTDIARLAAEKSLTPGEEAMETGILAARSGMFTRLEMDMTAEQTVYLQFAFDSREKAMEYMDAHREKRFVDTGYWDPERGIFMIIVAVECTLLVESMAREVVPIRQAGATLLDVETELDGLYRSEEDASDRYWIGRD